MSSLPIVKPLEYISPTTLMKLLECEFSVYLEKMSGLEVERESTTEQMALGTCFDAHVKNAINIHNDKTMDSSLGKLLKDLPSNMEHMIAYGKAVFDTYEYFGCLDELNEIGVEGLEVEAKKYIEYGGRGFNFFGFPDAVLSDGRVLDWKVSGWGGSRVRSPKPGYKFYKISDKKNALEWEYKGKHPSFGLSMEQIDTRWAIQLVCYNWYYHGYKPGVIYKGVIDQILLQNDSRVGVARYDTFISPIFSKELFEKACDIWERFGNGQIGEPCPAKWTCEPYGKKRPCTKVCQAYKNSLGDPLLREMM